MTALKYSPSQTYFHKYCPVSQTVEMERYQMSSIWPREPKEKAEFPTDEEPAVLSTQWWLILVNVVKGTPSTLLLKLFLQMLP